MDRRKSNNNQMARKRRRKISSNDDDQLSVVVVGVDSNQLSQSGLQRQWNIIDRVVDGCKYEDETQRSFSLYELCRGWIYAGTTLPETLRLFENAGLERTKLAAILATNDEPTATSPVNKSENVYTLSDPTDSEPAIVSEIRELNGRLGERLRQTQENDLEIVNSLKVDDQVMQTHALLKLHVNRWKAVRKEWNCFYNRVNSRYKQSEDVLKSLFEETQ